MTAPTHQLLRVDQVRQDGDTQFRTGVSRRAIEQFTEDIRNGDQFKPIITFFDGSHHWLADGHHRTDAHRAAGKTYISAVVHQGTQRDAQLFAIGANKSNNTVWRTRDDVRLAIDRMLHDAEWQTWNDSWIARLVGCSDKTVRSRREHLESTTAIPVITQYLREDGTVYPRSLPPRPTPSMSEFPTCSATQKLPENPLDDGDLPEDERGDAWEPPPAKPTVSTPAVSAPPIRTTIAAPPVQQDTASPAPISDDDPGIFAKFQPQDTRQKAIVAVRRVINLFGQLGIHEPHRDSLKAMLDALNNYNACNAS